MIDCATRQLTWSDSNKDVKCIFIAGNEPFTQGDVDYRQACKAAATKGVTVNTIFCGNLEEGVQTNWQDGARLADGQFLNIDQNRQIAAAPTPQDKELAQLGAQLNRTYLPYGDARKRLEAAQRQAAQDANAAQAAAGVAAARVAVKASGLYRNTGWDLVDALSEGKVKLDELKADELPDALRALAPAERQAHVEKLAAERKQIQDQINKLTAVRKVYLAEQEKKLQEQMQRRCRCGSGRRCASRRPCLRTSGHRCGPKPKRRKSEDSLTEVSHVPITRDRSWRPFWLSRCCPPSPPARAC